MAPIYMVLVILAASDVTQAAFNWEHRAGNVHACENDEAEFQQSYDSALYDVQNIFWRFKKDGRTVLVHHIKPEDKTEYYFPDYERRAFIMNIATMNAGLILKELTKEDEGTYLVELAGPEGAVDEAHLVVHTDVKPKVLVSNEETSFGSMVSIKDDDKCTITITTDKHLLADIEITVEDRPPVTCSATQVCSDVLTSNDIQELNKENITVRFNIKYQTCSPQSFVLFLEGGASGGSTGVIVGIIVAVILILIIATIVAIVLVRKRKRKSKEIKPPNDVEQPEERLLNTELEVKFVPGDGEEVKEEVKEYKDVPDKPEDKPDLDEPNDKPVVQTDLHNDIHPTIPDIRPTSNEIYNDPVNFQPLLDQGYIFNTNGELRSKDGDKPFEFTVLSTYSENQKRYEEIGQIITDYLYAVLEDKLRMKKINIPLDASPNEPVSFFFASQNAFEKDKLLILIHGSGVVRAGQWTRKLIMNDNLEKGSQIPYICWGLQHDYGVVVLNTNYNTENDTEIRESYTPEDHAKYVWDKFIEKSQAQNIAFVGHSYGGNVITKLALDKGDSFRKRVMAVAFTDSVHGDSNVDNDVGKFLSEHAVNWASSSEDLDKELKSYGRKLNAKKVSAGNPTHEWTSYSAMQSVFKFIENKYKNKRMLQEGD